MDAVTYMALDEPLYPPVREVVTRAGVVPESTPTEASMSMLAAWRAELIAGYPSAPQDVLARLDFLLETVDSLRNEASGLRVALISRTTIDEAQGVLIAQRGCNENAAFELLVEMSQQSNAPVRQVARAIVHQSVDA